MKDAEFKALISLLEDDDPNISTHIEQKIISMGEEVIPRLEKAWVEEKNQIIQTRIEDIIKTLQYENIVEELIEWQRSEDQDLLRGWFLVAQYNYPTLNYEKLKNAVSRITNRTFLEIRANMNIVDKLRAVSRMIFEKERFKADRKNLYNPHRYFLSDLFEKKLGTPISLSILYMIICQDLNINARGVILPGYFVLTIPGAGDNLYIDAFNRGVLFTKKDVSRYLKDLKAKDDPKFYEPASRREILKEFIKAIIVCYRKQNNREKIRHWEKLMQQLEGAQ
jgi:regulator of sirC expression with transglutaminase-like and TPR domain